MKRFKTLLLREWMQHQRGWLVLVGLPIVLFTAAGLFGQAHVDFGNDMTHMPDATAVAAGVIVGLGMLTLVLAWGAAVLQSPGLARRDTQDRSIEFWLSLPASHAESVGATLSAHLVLFPLAALAIGVAGGVLLSLPIVAKVFGLGAWFSISWSALLAATVSMALRAGLGIVLATLWLSPLILGTMAASAWLKRWGVPTVAAVLGLGGLLLDRVYGNPIVWDVLGSLGRHASRAFAVADRGAATSFTLNNPRDVGDAIGQLPAWCLSDAGHAIANLASPAFVGALAVGGAAFALLVLRRSRGA